MSFRIQIEMESYRITEGEYTSPHGAQYGAFRRQGPKGAVFVMIATDGKDDNVDEHLRGWEHVSASTSHRTPNWQEMCWIKDLFWEADDTVVQYHPAKTNYVNFHPFTLHLWRHLTLPFPLPPPIFVGPL